MSSKNDVIALACSDIHLCHTAPVWRSTEKNWYDAMKRSILQLLQLQKKYGGVPILCAGDIFDRWNSPPELLNWTISLLKKRSGEIYSVAGQHDLPMHNPDLLSKSAYHTLFLSGVIHPLSGKSEPVQIKKDVFVFGFNYGETVQNCPKKTGLSIALSHQYIWIPGYEHREADEKSRLSAKWESVLSYNTVIFGDNHIGFSTKIGKTNIFNCGSLMCRSSDQIHYRPQIGLILSDGRVVPHYLDCTDDSFLPVEEVKEDLSERMKQFFKEVQDLQEVNLDFEEYVRILSKKLPKHIQTILLSLLESVR